MTNMTPELKKDMESVWFTADLHAGHPKIIDICNRPIDVAYDGERTLKNAEYKSILDKAHNDWLVKEVINKWVKKKDTLFILGDVSLANRQEAEKFLDRLNGNKFLVIGNHDKNISNSTRFTQITQIKDFTYSKFGTNIHIVLCHYPIDSWNRRIHGSWHLYGHVHGRLNKDDCLAFDVGIDNKKLHDITGGIYRPLNLYEITNIMIEKKQNKIYENI